MSKASREWKQWRKERDITHKIKLGRKFRSLKKYKQVARESDMFLRIGKVMIQNYNSLNKY